MQWGSADAWRGDRLRKRLGCILDYESPRGYANSIVARKALRGSRIFIWVDQWSKKHVSSRMVFGWNVIRRTAYQSWSRVYRQELRQSSSSSAPPTSLPHESTGSTPIPESIECENADEQTRGSSSSNPTKNIKPNKKEDHEQVRGGPSFSEIPEWLQEFTENLVDVRVPEPHDSHASSLHGRSSEPQRRVVPGKHSVYSHFPKDRNGEICQRTKITRSPCRRRIAGVVPCAEIFGDLITADPKILIEGCASRNNHRYAVVVQDSATQWIQSYPWKNKNFTGN